MYNKASKFRKLNKFSSKYNGLTSKLDNQQNPTTLFIESRFGFIFYQ